MNDVLSKQIEALEASRNQAKAAHEEAVEKKKLMEEERQRVQAEWVEADTEEREAAKTVKRLNDGIRALSGEKIVKLNGSSSASPRRELDDLVALAREILGETVGGLEAKALEEALKEKVEGEKRGFHKRMPRFFKALEDDPRFHFDGRVHSLSPFKEGRVQETA